MYVWDRRKGERYDHFELFCAYRDAGPNRSLKYITGILEKKPDYIFRIAEKNEWENRAAAFDSFVNSIGRKTCEGMHQSEDSEKMNVLRKSLVRFIEKAENIKSEIDENDLNAKEFADVLLKFSKAVAEAKKAYDLLEAAAMDKTHPGIRDLAEKIRRKPDLLREATELLMKIENA